MLSPALVRAASALPALEIPAAAAVLRLQLELEPPALKSYQAVLSQADGSILWRSAQPLTLRHTSGIAFVSCELPVSLLPNGEYSLQLADAARRRQSLYQFAVQRQ